MKEELKQLYSETEFDVVLVRPPHGRKPQFDFFPDEHLGLTYLKAYLERHDYRVMVIDCHYLRLDMERLIRLLLKYDTTILGFTVFQPDIHTVTKIGDRLKQSGFKGHITLGGQFPSFEYSRILAEFPQIDSVVRSEGEESLVELLEYLRGKRAITRVQNLVYREDGKIRANSLAPLLQLDELPIPGRDHISEFPTLGIISSKGCYQNCSYCGVKSFYSEPDGPYLRHRSIPDLVDEIEFLYRKYRKSMFVFWDDNFLIPGKVGKKRIDEFCSEIKKRKLKIYFGFETRSDTIDRITIRKLFEIGLKYVFVGIESGSQESLEVFNKKVTVEQNWKALSLLSEEKVAALCAFIMYEPYSNVEKIHQNLQFLKKVFSSLDFVIYYPFSFTRLDILKGSPIHRQLLKQGRIIDRPLKDFMVEGDVYTIEDPRIEDLSKVTHRLDSHISDFRLTLWRYVSWFSGLRVMSTTRHFVDVSEKFENLLWVLNRKAINFTLKYLEDGLEFVQTPGYQKKMESFTASWEKKIDKLIRNTNKKLDMMFSKF